MSTDKAPRRKKNSKPGKSAPASSVERSERPGSGSARPTIRDAYSPRLRVARKFTEPSMTKQSFADEVNVNSIMKRFTTTGVLDHLNHKQPNYGFCTGEDFRESLATIEQARASFQEIPSEIRAEFGNDPALFLDFVSDPENRPELAEMGFLSPEAQRNGFGAENADKGVTAPQNGSAEPTGDPLPVEGGAGTVTT